MSARFSKTVVNFWLDVLLLVTFTALCWSAIIVRYVFPTPLLSEGWKLWGLDYLAWTDVQFAIHCLLVAEIVLHVMLHWSWVCGVVSSWRRKRSAVEGSRSAEQPNTGSRTLWGVGLLIAICNIVGLALAAAALSIQGPTT